MEYLGNGYSEQFTQWYAECMKILEPERNITDRSAMNITIVVTQACNFACTYCYQCGKTSDHMNFETAKKAVDLLLSDRVNNYIEPEKSPCVILDFIGGEPLLEIDLIDQFVDYFVYEAFRLNHRWANHYSISMSSNGSLYETPKVQKFIQKHRGRAHIAITIDGTKELHDTCRHYVDGRGTYDDVERNVKLYFKNGGHPSTKVTIAPENLPYLCDATLHLFNMGYKWLHCNVVFENVWNVDYAKELYRQLKTLADIMIERELYKNHSQSMFDETIGSPIDPSEDQNWCFKAGTSILTPRGSEQIENLSVGDLVITDTGSSQKINKVFKRISNNTATIQASGMLKTYTTTEHPYWVKKFHYRGFNGVCRYFDPEWVQVKDIKKGDKIALFPHKFGDVHVDGKLAYIVGRYIGDGWYSTTGYKLCCGYQDCEELTTALNEANINYSTDDYRTVRQFNIFKNNTELINILSQIGKSAFEKNIPKEAFRWDEESIKSLLRGFLDADGSYDKKHEVQKFSTVSPKLFYDVLILLRGLKYIPICYKAKRAGKSIIEGREVNIRDKYEVYWQIDSKRSKCGSYDETNNVIWATVKEVDLNCEPYEVYNLSVDKDNTYIANGSIVHNCGGDGSMLAIGPDGTLYPCLRYMKYCFETPDREPFIIGNLKDGIVNCEDCPKLAELKTITRSSQSTEECFNCPVAKGCSWCSAYNYDVFGTANKRATFHCIMQKARVLGNAYYWNKLYRKLGMAKRFEYHMPDEWALEIIDQNEINMLKKLSKEEDIHE